ncbi:MAG: D-TA family PLP-dependent enzyme, partial [Bryobacterales bacterium]|nr:D-TA family PLP-dependent enzyme [Bryobacterales bacterium]
MWRTSHYYRRDMLVSELETPALLIDLNVMEANLSRVAAYARNHDLRLRPHTKTHKSTAVGKLQLASGAAGLTVAKVGEAEVMIGAQPPELLVAYPVIGRSKLDRLMEVAPKTKLTVALDNLFCAQQLAEAARRARVDVGVLAEVDVGLGRVGVQPGEQLVQLAISIDRLPRLKLEGIAFYPGHIKSNDEQGERDLKSLSALVQSILADFKRAGIELKIVSGGSTPALFHSHEVEGVNEIRPGTYIYNDMNTVMSGGCGLEDCAASIMATVVSTAKTGQMIIDGGSKTFSSDRLNLSSEVTFGRLKEAPEAQFTKMNEEHGYVDIRRAQREFQIGDRVNVIPNHVCVAVNLHENVYGVRNGEVEQV